MKYLSYAIIITFFHQSLLNSSHDHPVNQRSVFQASISGHNHHAAPFYPSFWNTRQNHSVQTDDSEISIRCQTTTSTMSQSQSMLDIPKITTHNRKKENQAKMLQMQMQQAHERVKAGTAYQQELIPELRKRIPEEIETMKRISPTITKLFLQRYRSANISDDEYSFYELLEIFTIVQSVLNLVVTTAAQVTNNSEDEIRILARTRAIQRVITQPTVNEITEKITRPMEDLIEEDTRRRENG